MAFDSRLKRKAFLQLVLLFIVAGVLGTYLKRASFQERAEQQDPSMRLSANFSNLSAGVEKAPFAYKLVSKSLSKSYPGFTIIPVAGTAQTVLVNHSGDVVHRWQQDAERVRLLENCNLAVLHGSKWGYRQEKWRALKFSVREYNWNDQQVWNFETDEWTHHDILQRDNGNYVFLKRTTVPAPDTAKVFKNLGGNVGIRSDTILEVTRSKEVVWKWNVHDHFPLDQCGWRGCDYLRARALDRTTTKFRGDQAHVMGIDSITDWSHTNTVTEIPANRWHRAGDTRFTPGNLLIVIRNFWTAYIIEKTSGKLVWEYNGDPVPGDESSGLVRGHDMYMIPEPLPGAGNLLVFDNGLEGARPFSRILELNPVTKDLVWEYQDEGQFFSDAAGSVQRLPNGNTLISEDKSGRIFEVTAQGEIVWDMRGPMRISRAQRYPYNYCPELEKLPLR